MLQSGSEEEIKDRTQVKPIRSNTVENTLVSFLLSSTMAMTPVAASSPVSTYRLFRPDFIPKPPFLSFTTKRSRAASHRFTVRASANAIVESPNGVAASSSDIDSSDYGRKFFPLAAVVGQVREFSNCCNCESQWSLIKWRCV